MGQILTLDTLPEAKEEAWKYTPLKRAVPQGLQPVQAEDIHITCGQNSGQVVDISTSAENTQAVTQSIAIEVKADEVLTVIERHTGSKNGNDHQYWKNLTSHITLGEGAKLTHVQIIDESEQGVYTNQRSIALAGEAEYNCFTLAIGGKMTRNESHVRIVGEDAHAKLNGISYGAGDQVLDHTIVIDHEAPHTQSSQFFRNILNDTATGVFQGRVNVHKDAQHIEAHQLCNTILLSERAAMNTKPELEIFADDVECSHGATTGEMDADALFYLQSRGIPETQARDLLIEGFLNEVIGTIGNDDIEATIRQRLFGTNA